MTLENPPPPRLEADATLADLLRRTGEAGLDAAALRPTFDQFLEISRRFSELEMKVLGGVNLQFPAYMFEGQGGPVVDPVREGVEQARRERERLDLGPAGVDDVLDLVEAQGLKVIQIPFPPDSALLGVFLFDARLGPVLLVDASRPRPERDYAAAHLYGHFLADYDPYHSWVCLLAGEAEAAPEELRARVFAGAFLVPPEGLELYLKESRHRAGQPMPAALFEQLRIYFGADDRALIGALLAGGWLEAEAIPELLARVPLPAPAEVTSDLAAAAAAPPPGPRNPGGLPARYVALALAAHKGGALTLAETARYLEVDESTALALEASMSPPEQEEGHGRRPS